MTVDALKSYGLTEMTDAEIRDFLTHQGFGVLGLSGDAAPYLVPLSFGYDGHERLYFSFFQGDQSQKRALADGADVATFLVFSPTTPFFWESVSLSGPIESVPEADWDDHEAAMDNAWHLDLFERADTAGGLGLYVLRVREKRGLKYAGLPPGLREPATAEPTDR